MERHDVGPAGEEAAAGWYRARGYEIVARNWRSRLGEVDLLARRGDVVVVCEVKTRRGSAHGAPFEAVHERKRAKLRALAELFVLSRGLVAEAVRFDVASVSVSAGGGIDVHVFEDAF